MPIVLKLIVYPTIYLLSLLFPKNKKLFIFGSWFGDRYADNSKYLFEEMVSSYGSIVRSVWITKNKNVISFLQRKGYEVYFAYSIKGIYLQLRASVFFCSVNSKDFFFATLTFRNKIIQLWHGTPLKKVNFDVFTGKRYFVNFLRSVLIDKYFYVLFPSSIVDSLVRSSFRVGQERILRGGVSSLRWIVY